MNTKNMLLTMFMVLSTASVLCSQNISYAQEQTRIEQIALLSKNNALNEASYVVNGRFTNALIERDIALFEKDATEALAKKSWTEGYLYSYMVPAVLKTAAVTTGVGAVGAGVGAGGAGYLFNNIWNNPLLFKATDYAAPTVIKLTSNTMADSLNSWLNYWKFKHDYIEQRLSTPKFNGDRNILNYGPAVAIGGGVAALVLAGASKYLFGKLSRYNQNNAALIQELQARYERDQVVIAQLKSIQYAMNR